MTNEVQLYRDGDQVTISVGGQQSTMHMGEWSKLIVTPKSPNVFVFARAGSPPDDFYSTTPSECEPEPA